MAKKKGAGKMKGLGKPGKPRPGGQWVQRGDGLWDWIKGAAGTVWNGLKSTKALSTIAGMTPHPYAKAGAVGLRAVGLGKGGARPVKFGAGRSQTGLGSLNGRLYIV